MSTRLPRIFGIASAATYCGFSRNTNQNVRLETLEQKQSVNKSKGIWAVEDKQERDFCLQRAIGERLSKQLDLQPARIRGMFNIEHKADPSKVGQTKTAVRRQKSLRTHVSASLRLNMPVDFEQVEDLRNYMESHVGGVGCVSSEVAVQLLREFATKYLETHRSPVASLSLPENGRVIVVGDTHGQLRDVVTIFRKYGPPTKDNVYVFNGDISDRGKYCVEIWFLVCAYFLADPRSVVINRGNHEWEPMNEMDRTDGGGFLDEVLKKFDYTVFGSFTELFKVLSLCTVIGEKVCVLHGGLSPHRDLTLDRIREIPHTSLVQPDEVKTELDEIWQCLLWSDPSDTPGHEPSTRGCGIKFGPDITKAFLKNNSPLELLIRSHELPGDGVGFETQHDNKCITVFSASNYFGDARNKAAILVFEAQSFPEYKVWEYVSPPMKQITTLVARNQGVEDWIKKGLQLREEDAGAMDSKWWEKELRSIMVTIVESKSDLYAHCMDVNKGSPLVDQKRWIEIMSDVCGHDWNWNRAWHSWKLGEDTGYANFVDFLRRFTAVFDRDEYMSFKFKVIIEVFQNILDRDQDLQSVIDMFDKDGDGRVTVQEMHKALSSFDVGLTASQLESFIGAVFRGALSVPVAEFMGRLALLFEHAKEALVEPEGTEANRLLKEVMRKLGHTIATKSVHDIMQSNDRVEFKEVAEDSLAEKLLLLFRAADVNGDGRLSTEEFVDFIWKLPQVQQIELSNGQILSYDKLRQLMSLMDHDSTGTIEIFEWMNAFSIDDGSTLEADILADSMISVLMRYRTPIRACCRCYDPQHHGSIKRAEFQRILEGLNVIIADTNNHWSSSQISDLCDSFALDGETISYNRIFESLQVVDSQHAGFAVALTSAD